MNLFRKQKQSHRLQKQTRLLKGTGSDEVNQEFGLKYTHYLGKETEKEQIYVYV